MASTRRADDVTATVLVLFSACAVLLVLGGCGKPSADETPAPRAGPQVGAIASPVGTTSEGETSEDVAPLAAPTAVEVPKPSRSASTLPAQPARPDEVHPQQSAVPASPTAEKERQERTVAEQAQWHAWFAAARESPDVGIRLQALEQWAQRPGEALDPVTYGLVDEDESVRTLAQELYQEQLAREAMAAMSLPRELPEPSGER